MFEPGIVRLGVNASLISYTFSTCFYLWRASPGGVDCPANEKDKFRLIKKSEAHRYRAIKSEEYTQS
jgi:hypothetical protein